MKKIFSLSLSLIGIVTLSGCIETSEEEVKDTPDANETIENTADTENKTPETINELVLELRKNVVINREEHDIITVLDSDGSERFIALPGQPGETEYYENAPAAAEDTVATYYSYWAGFGDLTRVRYEGNALIFETMGIGEPSPELEGLPCEPWTLIETVDIGKNAEISVSSEKAALEYRPDMECDCQESAAIEGYYCIE